MLTKRLRITGLCLVFTDRAFVPEYAIYFANLVNLPCLAGNRKAGV